MGVGANKPAISLADLDALRMRVFGTRASTLECSARDYKLDVLCRSVASVFDAMLTDLDELPERAFGRQPDDIDGNDVWSAGEIVSHLAEMELAAVPYWELVTGNRLPDPPAVLLSAIEQSPETRPSSVAVLTEVAVWSAKTLDIVQCCCNGEEIAAHFMLGRTSVNAAVLATAFHLLDHYHQIRALGRQVGGA